MTVPTVASNASTSTTAGPKLGVLHPVHADWVGPTWLGPTWAGPGAVLAGAEGTDWAGPGAVSVGAEQMT
ncbi:hypothetical protein ACWCQN_43985 [Streptomyces sp. NPDC001984]